MGNVESSSVSDPGTDDPLVHASRELAACVSVISGYLETLEGSLAGKECFRQILSTMRRHMEQTHRILNDMRIISTLDAPCRESRQNESVEIGSCLRDVVHALQPLIKEKNAEISTEISAVVVSGDQASWFRVLARLIEHALRQHGPGPLKLRIKTGLVRNGCLHIGVTCADGSGNPVDRSQAERQIAFPPSQIGSLALCVVRRTVEALGGTMTATAGEHTTFAIYVPVAPISPPAL